MKIGRKSEPIKVLLDNGILSHAEFAENAVQEKEILFGQQKQTLPIHGFIRKSPQNDSSYQSQTDALFTIGRLIREGKIIPFCSTELKVEAFRSISPNPVYYALKDCEISYCPPPIERSKFRITSNSQDYFAKGGKKDKKRGINLGDFNQISFMEWLKTLDKSSIALLIEHSETLGLSDFEVGSMKDIGWYQFVCGRSNSRENFPDIFHLWTAERNSIDVFLTLEKKLPNIIAQIRKEKQKTIEISTEVFRPLEFLNWLGIDVPDEVPIEFDRFYYWHEVT